MKVDTASLKAKIRGKLSYGEKRKAEIQEELSQLQREEIRLVELLQAIDAVERTARELDLMAPGPASVGVGETPTRNEVSSSTTIHHYRPPGSRSTPASPRPNRESSEPRKKSEEDLEDYRRELNRFGPEGQFKRWG